MTTLESIGIIGGLILSGLGLLLNALATFRNNKASKLLNYQEITKSHRELWKLTLNDTDKYSRIFSEKVNLSKKPITYHEHRFIHLLLLHMTTVYNFSKHSHLIEIEKMKVDIGEFLSFPIPYEVWKRTKFYFNRDFITFVEKSIDEELGYKHTKMGKL